jgi:universal stress protein A
MGAYKKIMVAIDINAEHENVIRKALKMASSPDDVSLVYISLSAYYVQPYLYGMSGNYIDYEGIIKNAKEKLEGIAEKFGIAKKHTYVKSGEAADEIKNLANEHHAELIVIGTHGRSGIKLLLGSTANAVLHGVKQDVLAVRVHE